MEDKLFDYDTVITEEFDNISFQDLIKFRPLKPGMIVYFTNNVVHIVGNCTPYMSPSTNDGGRGWIFADFHDWKVSKVTTIGLPHCYVY